MAELVDSYDALNNLFLYPWALLLSGWLSFSEKYAVNRDYMLS